MKPHCGLALMMVYALARRAIRARKARPRGRLAMETSINPDGLL